MFGMQGMCLSAPQIRATAEVRSFRARVRCLQQAFPGREDPRRLAGYVMGNRRALDLALIDDEHRTRVKPGRQPLQTSVKEPSKIILPAKWTVQTRIAAIRPTFVACHQSAAA